MTSTYRAEDEVYKSQRAKRSKAGSLRPPRISTPRTKRQGSAPQAIVKVAGWANAPSSVKRMLDYIARIEDKENRELVSLESEDGIQRQGKAEVDEIYDEWKDDFHRKKQRSKSSRHAVHLVLSAKADLTGKNVEKTLKAARRTIEEHFGDRGYKYALGVHQDGKSPHVHAVIKTISSNKDAPKLRLNPKTLLEIRKTFAAELTREGLEHVATREPKKRKARHSKMKGKKPNTLIKVQAVLKNMNKEQRQFERSLTRKEPKVNAFKYRRQQGKTLETLRSQVKEDKVLTDKERKEAFNLIRRFRRGIEKKGIDAQRDLRATVNHFEDRFQKWTKDFEQARDGSESQTRSARQVELQKVLKTGKDLQNEMEQFYGKDLRQANLPTEDKKKAFSQLRKRGLEIKKVSELVKGRSR